MMQIAIRLDITFMDLNLMITISVQVAGVEDADPTYCTFYSTCDCEAESLPVAIHGGRSAKGTPPSETLETQGGRKFHEHQGPERLQRSSETEEREGNFYPDPLRYQSLTLPFCRQEKLASSASCMRRKERQK
ncbi:hypothetical protein GQ55_2G340800 [Panicum hallii var. hallii]|uniref:Uncharacterized protein n=1 Tax=Panicum hallii var. hallii TaxID=1504633 RepID=A0A2T7EVB8_9POAL|nr:hypothetical protein GQ55_2G340800 [Panicum hallii var. hallii]